MQRGRNGQGYVYYRDRSRGNDATVLEHQLMMLLEEPPGRVFDPAWDVHHQAPAPDANVPWLLELVDRDEHRSRGGDRYWNPRKGVAD